MHSGLFNSLSKVAFCTMSYSITHQGLNSPQGLKNRRKSEPVRWQKGYLLFFSGLDLEQRERQNDSGCICTFLQQLPFLNLDFFFVFFKGLVTPAPGKCKMITACTRNKNDKDRHVMVQRRRPKCSSPQANKINSLHNFGPRARGT